MEKKVVLSLYSVLMSILAIAIVIALFAYEIKFHQYLRVFILGLFLVLLVALILLYSPMSIAVTDDSLIVKRPLKSKIINLKDIESVQLVGQTMTDRCLLGSAGWMGHWGWFRDKGLGRYFAYYGKPSSSFLVKLKSGRQYMLGCKDPQEMVDYLQSKINS